jgi:hypothetical protein
MGGIVNNPQLQNAINFRPQQPGQPQQPFGQQTTSGGPLPQFTLPSHYQSPFASYGFDPGLQSYLDQQMYRSYTDGGVGYQYDPTNQTFTGGTMGGRYNPIPLNVMQQAAGGNRDVLSPYFQSKYPQSRFPQSPMPDIKNPIVELPRDPVTNRFYNPNDRQTPQQPMPGQVRPPNMPFYQNPNPRTYGAVNNNGVTAQTPANPQRGLGGLQLNKFRNRLG